MEITGYENYLIYDDGRVFSKTSKKFLKPYFDKYGYFVVDIYKNKKRKNYKVHRLVAECYIPNIDNKPKVDHINRIRNDNRVENLRWATVKENNNNKSVQSNNKLGLKNICMRKDNTYRIQFKKNDLNYSKSGFKTLEESIKQRDLMLSMF